MKKGFQAESLETVLLVMVVDEFEISKDFAAAAVAADKKSH